MPRKLSEKQKIEMVESFTKGDTIEQIAESYQITTATTTRYLKKEFDLNIFKSLVKKNKKNNEDSQEINNKNAEKQTNRNDLVSDTNNDEEKIFFDHSFIELTPLNYNIDNASQKDLSSVSINEIDLPKVVYMIVDNKIELETKLLKDYPDWQFLSQNELDRKTIEIFFDPKIAKRFCKKEQKVIKVPNPNVFSIAAPILVARGISRIVCPDKLISL